MGKMKDYMMSQLPNIEEEIRPCPLCGSPRLGHHVDVSASPKFTWCANGFDSSRVIVAVEP